MDLATVIGTGLRRRRVELGLRQEDVAELARAAGLSWGRSAIAEIEAGTRSLDVSQLSVAALLLDMSLASFFLPSAEVVQLTPAASASKATLRRLFQGATGSRGDLYVQSGANDFVRMETSAEAELKAARRLEMSGSDFRAASEELWDEDYVTERERRVRERVGTPTSARSLQAIRGAVSRELLNEIRRWRSSEAEQS